MTSSILRDREGKDRPWTPPSCFAFGVAWAHSRAAGKATRPALVRVGKAALNSISGALGRGAAVSDSLRAYFRKAGPTECGHPQAHLV